MNLFNRLLLLIFFIILNSGNAYADRLKDLTSIAGVRTNQLVGYGIVVGLRGTGDTSIYAVHGFTLWISN